MRDKLNVLFLCRANAARSVMAEALLRELAGDRFNAFSAGVMPALQIHRLTIERLKSTISNLDVLHPKSWIEFSSKSSPSMDVIIALSNEAVGKNAPVFPGAPVFSQWTLPDPLVDFLIEDAQKIAFEQVYLQILRRISVFITLPLQSMTAPEQARALSEPPDIEEETPSR